MLIAGRCNGDALLELVCIYITDPNLDCGVRTSSRAFNYELNGLEMTRCAGDGSRKSDELDG